MWTSYLPIKETEVNWMHVLMKFDSNFFDWHNGVKMQFYMASYKTDVTFNTNQIK